jgi:hypothetical protein
MPYLGSSAMLCMAYINAKHVTGALETTAASRWPQTPIAPASDLRLGD